MLTENIVSLSISALALIVSVVSAIYAHKKYLMYRFEFKLRRKDEKRAVLATHAEKLGGGRFRVYVSNVGQSEARNVTVDFDNDTFDGFYAYDGRQLPFPSLRPHEEFGMDVCRDSSHNECFIFQVAWDDDLAHGNVASLAVSLVCPEVPAAVKPSAK